MNKASKQSNHNASCSLNLQNLYSTDPTNPTKTPTQSTLANDEGIKKVPQKKFGIFDQMWAAFIRPANRFSYNTKCLGPRSFLLKGTVFARREDFVVKNSRDFKLECSYFEPIKVAHTKHPCIIYLHGNSSSRLEGLPLLETCLPFGISFLVMDFSGCGISEGEYISMGYFEKQDVKKVMDHVMQWKDVTEFGLWGRSMGAATAIMTALLEDESIRYIVADSCFVSTQRLCREFGKRIMSIPNCLMDCAFGYIRRKVKEKANFDIINCNVLQIVQNLKRNNLPNILFLAGKQDNLVSHLHSKDIFNNYSGPKELILFEGTHNSIRSPEILKQISSFFCKGLFDEYAQKQFPPSKKQFFPYWINQKTDEEGKDNQEQKICLKEDHIIEESERKQESVDHSIKLDYQQKRAYIISDKDSKKDNISDSAESRYVITSRYLGSLAQIIKKDEDGEEILTTKIKIQPHSNGQNEKLKTESVNGEFGTNNSKAELQCDISKINNQNNNNINQFKRNGKAKRSQSKVIPIRDHPSNESSEKQNDRKEQYQDQLLTGQNSEAGKKSKNQDSQRCLFSQPITCKRFESKDHIKIGDDPQQIHSLIMTPQQLSMNSIQLPSNMEVKDKVLSQIFPLSSSSSFHHTKYKNNSLKRSLSTVCSNNFLNKIENKNAVDLFLETKKASFSYQNSPKNLLLFDTNEAEKQQILSPKEIIDN